MSAAPRRNTAGRAIWFVPHESGDGGGIYRPVAPEGRRAFALAAIWIVSCGTGGMVAFALTWEPWCFAGMSVAGAAGLALFARTVIRHS